MTQPCSFHSFISHLVALNCGRLGRNPYFGMDHFLDVLDVWHGLAPVMPSLRRLSERHDLTLAYSKRKYAIQNLWRFCEFPLQQRYQPHTCLALRGISWLKGCHGGLVLDWTNKTMGRRGSEEMPFSPWASRPLWPQEVVHALLAVLGAEAAQVLAVHAHAAPARMRSSQSLFSTATHQA